MKLHYFTKNNNFGDALNPWFWKLIFGREFDGTPDELFLGVGTLINDKLPENVPIHIFGSGAGYGDSIPRRKDQWIVHCVRGPLTAKALGVNIDKAISDPVIMLGNKISNAFTKKHSCSFMPHIGIDSVRFSQLCEDMNIHYISPCWDREKVIQSIGESEKLICSAMHGAILAEALRVPWFPTVTSDEILAFKWMDWCHSLEMEYKPLSLPVVWPTINSGVINKLRGKIKDTAVQKNIRRISRRKDFVLSEDAIFHNRIKRFDEVINDFQEYLLKREKTLSLYG